MWAVTRARWQLNTLLGNMTNLLPGVALWRAGRKVWAVVGGVVWLLLVVPNVLYLFSDAFYYQLYEGIPWKQGQLGFEELQKIRWATLPLMFSWLLWGHQLWWSKKYLRNHVQHPVTKLCGGLICPGLIDRIFDPQDATKAKFLFWNVTIGGWVLLHAVVILDLLKFVVSEHVTWLYVVVVAALYVMPLGMLGVLVIIAGAALITTIVYGRQTPPALPTPKNQP